jgi:osmotically-inducible protein OsmY
MIRLLFGFVLGLIAGAFGYAWLQQPQNKTKMAATNDSLRAAVQQKLNEIHVEDIRQELERTGMVVRDKVGKWSASLAEGAADAKITAAIKSKLFTEPGVSSMSIQVTTTDGLVTLSGTAESHDQLAKAMRIALNTEGVRKVVSTVQVKAPQK